MTIAERRALPLAVALALLWPGAPDAQPSRLGDEAGRAVQAFDAAAELLKRARAAAEALEAGQEPQGSPAELAGMPAALARAAEALRRAAAPALADPTIFTISPEALRGCSTRAAALATAEEYRRELQGELQRVTEMRAQLRERVAAALAAEEGRKVLLRVKARPLASPAGAEWLPWARADLDRPLALAIQASLAELRRWQERADGALGELRARAGAFAAMAAEYGRQHDCALAGTWLGLRQHEGAVSGVSLRLASQGSHWSGEVNVDGAALPVRGVAVQGASVTITLGEGGSLHGTLSGDDQVLRATLSSVDGTAQLTLRRQ